MIQINLNIIGTPEGLIELKVDTSPITHLATVEGQRAAFILPDSTPPHGFTIYWNENKQARSVIPNSPGSYEGSLLNPPLPDLEFKSSVPIPLGLSIEGDHFIKDGERFYVKGSTDFRLPERELVGVDIQLIIDDRTSIGCNWFRILSMKFNNTGYEFLPNQPGHDEALIQTFEKIGKSGAYCQCCIFADTKKLMPNASEQQEYYERMHQIMLPYRDFILPEFCNEASHSTQSIKPSSFQKYSEFLMSHGSETSDKQPVQPFWDFATYSARRSPGYPNPKVATNYDSYVFREQFPMIPFIPQETVKPEDYGNDPNYAALLGKHARVQTGAVFHHNAWRDCRPFSPGERECAIAFYRELE